MPIENWSDNVLLVELANDPQFSDDLTSLTDALEAKPTDVVLNFAAVAFINSSNVAKLLRLRKLIMGKSRHLILCDINTQVWGVFLVTGLDKIFEVAGDVSTALTTLQLAVPPDEDATV